MSIPPRTTVSAVQSLLGDDYGPNSQGNLPDLNQFIAIASNLVDVVSADSSNNGFSLTAVNLEVVERCLAAAYYCRSDPTYSSRSTEGASGSFIRPTLETEPYLAMAIDADYSGSLNAILKRQRASGQWLGKPADEWLTWWQRNGSPPGQNGG